jgi:hypothetical protein
MVLARAQVAGVADAAHRGLDAGLGQALGVADADVLRSLVRMMDKAILLGRTAFVERLLQRVGHELGPHRGGHSPAHDAPGEDIDDEGHMDENPCHVET